MRHPSLAMVGVIAAVVLVLVGVGVAVGIRVTRDGDSGDRPLAPTTNDRATDPASTQLPSPDDSYWTPERMRNARPAPMPTE